MKKILFILTLSLTSCMRASEDAYYRAYWEYKTKELHLDYLKKLNEVSDDAELKRTILYLDSLKKANP